ncbi:MAG TPA: response regulator transcription factor [Candidatus Saccharimonadales bacterium]|nr:response regulator transcription factor [Candidatus Saccharimonadales bacterium]
MVSIVIADDHQVVRQGLRLLLELERDFFLAGEAADGVAAIRLVQKTAPDILLLDLMMPLLDGLEVIRQLKSGKAETKILVLSMNSDETSIADALHHGADGYVLKTAGSQELIEAIRRVWRGENHFCRAPKTRRASADVFDTLTRRERTVLPLIAEGQSSAQIAARLFISRRTVETHRKNILQKLHLHSQTELVRFAIRKKIIAA